MNAAERIDHYLKARKSMRHMDEAYIHWINAGDEAEAILQASDISQLLQQRAELLEALKYINRFIEPTAVDAESMKKHAAKAIAKAEQ